jgi:hypothetical protein
VQIDSGAGEVLPVCSILLGFLFAGFWRTLNREPSFKAEDRHFKPGITLLSRGGDAWCVRSSSVYSANRLYEFSLSSGLSGSGFWRCSLVLGHMLTDIGHYGLLKLPKYRTNSERMLFAATLVTVLGLIAKWCFS